MTNDSSQVELKAALARALRERDEAHEQQAATATVLKVISGSTADLPGALDRLLETACRLCEADIGTIRYEEDDHYRLAATFGCKTEWRKHFAGYSGKPDRTSVFGQTILKGGTVHIPDVLEDTDYARPEAQKLMNLRAALGVPLVRDGRVFGVVNLFRTRPRAFTEKQIELAETFADQAVIAIENMRLLTELRQRTDDLTESLEQQTATSEILQVISNSPINTQPVFDTIVQSALRLFPDAAISIVLPDGDKVNAVASNEADAARAAVWRAKFPIPLTREYLNSVAILDAKIVDIPDVRDVSPDFAAGGKNFLEAGYLAVTCVPLMRGDTAIGALSIMRQTAGPLSDKQLALVKTFANQAVIAIENTRLFRELRERTDDLSESLQQQTATADVLKVISRSTFDLQTVLDTLIESASELCGAKRGHIFQFDGEYLRFAAAYGAWPEFAQYLDSHPMRPGRGTIAARAAAERRTVQCDDVAHDPDYEPHELMERQGYRTVLAVPMLREGVLRGVITLLKTEVEPFTDKQIELIETFADQAVIAIENVRLFEEVQARTEDLQESLQQQTATADVLKVISRSAFDLQTVLDTLLRSAGRLCDANMGVIVQRKGDFFYRAVSFGLRDDFAELVKNEPVEMARTSGSGRALVEGKVVHIFDIEADPEYTHPGRQMGGFRTLLGVPMVRDEVAVGVLTLMRIAVQPFTEKQIKLVSTFADQAAIAIENVRLFDEIQEKSRQLEEASKHKSQFLANMSHELRTPLNAILGYTELIADGIYGDTPEKVQTTLKRIISNGRHLLGLINDVLDLSKIEAGQLTLSLGEYSLKDVVHDVYGAVEPLAVEKKLGFKVEIAPNLSGGHGDERRLTQVLLNLVGNAIKFTDSGEVAIKASQSDGVFSVAVCDTGPGISKDDQKRLFQEFQQADSSTTKKKGGTGLGLAISKRIIELHGGKIWLESRLGEGSTFTFTVPVRAEQATRQAS